MAEFSRNASRPDGLQHYCKACYSVRAAATYRRRRERDGFTVRVRPDVPEGHKYCPRCEQVKPHADFTRHRQQAGGFASYCKPCKAQVDNERRVQRVYGLSLAEIEAMVEAQGGLCAVCGKRPAKHVDHDHATGRVRGVLCFQCNAALGQVEDSTDTLRSMIDYIERTS